MKISCDQPNGNTCKKFCISAPPEGMQMVVVDYTWSKNPKACLRIPSTNPETTFLYAKPLHL